MWNKHHHNVLLVRYNNNLITIWMHLHQLLSDTDGKLDLNVWGLHTKLSPTDQDCFSDFKMNHHFQNLVMHFPKMLREVENPWSTVGVVFRTNKQTSAVGSPFSHLTYCSLHLVLMTIIIVMSSYCISQESFASQCDYGLFSDVCPELIQYQYLQESACCVS